MNISTETSGPFTTIALVGRFDAFETEGYDAVVDPLITEAVPRLTVDLSNVEFVDSSGLAALVRSMKRCREAGGDLTLHDPSEPVTVILELTRLDAAFDITRS